MRRKAEQDTLSKTAELIKGIRASLKMTQAQFAAHIGAGQSSVSRWEKAEAPPDGLYMATLIELGLEHRVIENTAAGLSMPIVGVIEDGVYLDRGRLPDEDQFHVTIPRSSRHDIQEPIGFEVQSDSYENYARGTILVTVGIDIFEREMRKVIPGTDEVVVRIPRREGSSAAALGIQTLDKKTGDIEGIIVASYSPKNF